MKQLGELHVGDYMTRQTISSNANDPLTTAIQMMDDQDLSVLPVLDDEGSLVGILSSSDLIEITHEIQADIKGLASSSRRTRDFLIKLLLAQGDSTLVSDVMTSNVATTTPTTNLVVAAKKLVDREFHHLPVVDENGRPVGILSTTDVVRAIADYGALTVS